MKPKRLSGGSRFPQSTLHKRLTNTATATSPRLLRQGICSTALALLLLLALPLIVEAQFLFTTNNGSITITGYTEPGGPVGAVTIPDTIDGWPVTTIGAGAFYAATNMTSLSIPASVTSIGQGAFRSCTGLSSLTIPDNLTAIGDEAFLQCASLTNVTLGTNVASIGTRAFAYSGLASVAIPGTVNHIGDQAFYQSMLKAISVDTSNPVYSSVAGVLFDKSQATLICYPVGLGGSYTIPSTVTSVGNSAFYGCTHLASVTIPNSVVTIGDMAFYECWSLTNVAIAEGVTGIGGLAFYSCYGLTNLAVPSSVTNIGDGAFYDCWSLVGMVIPNGVSNIGGAEFMYCRSLTSISIPNSVTAIGDTAFYGCWSLAGVAIPDRVTSIGTTAFFQCQSLTNVTFPSSVTFIGLDAFDSCSRLTNAFFEGNAPFANSPVFAGTRATVYYLPGTTGWGTTFGGRPAVLWNPQVLTRDGSFGVRNNAFGFNITGTTNIPIVVEGTADLASHVWVPLQSCTITNGSIYFGDPQWTNYPARYYRIRSP